MRTMLLLILSTLAAVAQEIPQALQTWKNVFDNNWWPVIVNAQTNYLATNIVVVATEAGMVTNKWGRFWQGTDTHATPPDAEGLGATPDNDRLTHKYPYNNKSWGEFGIPFPAMHGSIRMDQYAAPGGVGFTLTYTSTYRGETWSFVRNHGPETWREQGWARRVAP